MAYRDFTFKHCRNGFIFICTYCKISDFLEETLKENVPLITVLLLTILYRLSLLCMTFESSSFCLALLSYF